MIILNANDHGKAQALTRLITRFPDIIDHGVPLTGTASTPLGSPLPLGIGQAVGPSSDAGVVT
jgi:hypothetical protein